jgi:DNA-directed RNA polymerase specialized sigma24 family protein
MGEKLGSCNNAPMNNTEQHDAALIGNYARGDAAAFDQLYRRYELCVWRYLERNVRNQAICDELLQEVWFALARNTASLESTARLTSRLFTLAHDRMIGALGARAAQASPAATANQPAVARDKANVLARAIGQLPREQREAYLLQIEGELSVGEIAEITEGTLDMTDSHLRLARLKRNELLGEKGGSEVPPSQDPLSEVDHLYRRLSALDPSRPSEWVRRKVQAYAAQQAAERTVRESAKAKESAGAVASTPRATPVPTQAEPTAKKPWLLPVTVGAVAAVALVGFLVVPRLMTSRNTSMPAPSPAPVSQPDTATRQVAEASAPRSSESASSAAPSPALQSSEAALPAAPPAASQSAAPQLTAPTSPAPTPVAPRSSAPPAPVVASNSGRTLHAQSPTKVAVARQSAPITSDRAENAAQAAPPAPPVNSAHATQSTSVPPTDTKVASAVPPSPAVPPAVTQPAPLPPAAPPAVAQPAPTPAAAPVAAASNPPDGLWRAAESGDIPSLQAALTGNVDAKGHTALIIAIMNGHVGTIRALLAHGANPNTPDSRGATPLRAAYDRGNSDIVLLLQRHDTH